MLGRHRWFSQRHSSGVDHRRSRRTWCSRSTAFPAIFAITTDPYIVHTGNIFGDPRPPRAVFALAAMVHRFEYLKYALSLVLIFIGAKT